MAKTTAPLMAFGASGKIADSIVFASWKGIRYARKYAIPSNPKTTAQSQTRDAFKWLHESYKYFPPEVTAMWAAYAMGKPLTGANAYMQANLPDMRGDANLADWLLAKPVGGGPQPAGIVLTPGASKITVTLTAPTLPDGWTIQKSIALAMKNATFPSEADARINAKYVDNATPFTGDITGLTTGVVYRVGGFFLYTRADGTDAYGGSISDVATPT